MHNRVVIALFFVLAIGRQSIAADVWLRVKVTAPADAKYWAHVPDAGAVGVGGFYAKADKLPAPKPEDAAKDMLKAGDWSAWVPMPPTPRQSNSYSGTEYGFSKVLFHFGPNQPAPPNLTIAMEFSKTNSPDGVFHRVDAEPAEAVKPAWTPEGYGVVAFYVPKITKPEDYKKLETIHEASLRRLKLIEGMKLGDPPHLTKLRVGTWINMSDSGRCSRVHAATDLRIAELLGINVPLSVVDFNLGPNDADFAELCAAHGQIATGWTAWGGKEWLAPFSKEAGITPKPPVDPKAPPPPPAKNLTELEARWRADNEKAYGDQAAMGRVAFPKSWQLFQHINLGDEIGPVFNAGSIAKDPSLLAAFQDVMRTTNPKLTPQMLGAASWEAVQPLDDRKKVNSPETTRLFYQTWRAIDVMSAAYYRTMTDAIHTQFPQATFVGVNYQAGPAQYAFIGNTNDLNAGMLDFFEWSRRGAFFGVMTEDWVAGWDLGVGQLCLAGDFLRCAGRKHNDPLASYVVGGENPAGELFAYLMQGVKENNYYLYGPYTNIGPCWADNPDSLAAVGKVTRQLKKFEDAIAAGHVRPARAAMLIATTSDIMQVKGTFFCPERQFLYIALKHGQVPVDIVCEQDIAEDDLLKKYDVLYVTDPQVRRDVQEKIAAWIEAGGNLWAGPVAAKWDEYNQPSDVLNAALGVSARDVTFQDPWPAKAAVPWATTEKKLEYKPLDNLKPVAAGLFGDATESKLPVSGMKITCTPANGATVLAKCDDGKPAVVLNTFGKGRALLVGAQVGQEYVTQHYAKKFGDKDFDLNAGAAARRLACGWADEAKLVAPAKLSTPGVHTSVWDTPQGTLLFVLNNTGKKVDADAAVQIPRGKKAASVESAAHGVLKSSVDGTAVRFTLTCDGTDIVLIRH